MKYNIKHILTVLLVLACSGSLMAQEGEPTDTTKAILAGEKKVNVLYGVQKYDRFVGNMDAVSGDKLLKYPTLNPFEALRGQLSGVFIRQKNGSPTMVDDNFNLNIRGNVGESNIILVDGVERELSPYDIDQIEEITVLKDPVSKALYGGRKSNGIILVKTKRGKEGKNVFNANVQRGVKMPTVLPSYLNAFNFANAYNTALQNDNNGVMPTGKGYDQTALEAFQNGTNPYQYPDVDYYGQFLNKSMDITRATAEYYGGNATTQYYVHGGYQKEGGLETYAPKPRSNNAFNLQGNLDSKFSEDISVHANFAGYYAKKLYPAGFNFNTLSSRYPDAYPILVRPDSAGGTPTFKDNPFAAQKQSGYIEENHIRMQTDLSFDVNLGKLIQGLSFRPELSFDIYHKQDREKKHTVGIYGISGYDAEGNPLLAASPLQTYVFQSGQSLGDDDFGQRWGATGTLSWKRQFGAHAVDADAVYYISKYRYAGDLQDYKRQNLGLRTNYNFAGKYTLEGVLNYAGSQSFEPEKRFKLFPAVGAGWIVSNENFLKNIAAINYLKVNASWGICGNGNIEMNQWRETWNAGTSYVFNNNINTPTALLSSVYSDILDWPTQSEVDISIEAIVFKGLGLKFTYFDYLESGYLAKGSSYIPFLIGSTNFMPQTNFGKTGMNGIEAEINYSGNVGDFKYMIGAHLTNSNNEKIKIDEVYDPNYTTKGTAWNAIWGYKAIGTYTADEIAAIKAGTSSLPLPSFIGPQGLMEGNIKYADLNNDGTIDKYDTRVIGNNSPDMMFGGDLMLSYKGIELYAMVIGYSRFDNIMNTAYYQINSTRKYSTVVNDGLPNGNAHPRLTTTSGINDFQSSDYWIANNGFVKLQNVSLSYSLPKKWITPLKLSGAKVSLYGTDLLRFSKIKKSDPESLNAGVTDFPLFSTYAAGITISF
jgi:TonB-linked SusC/RagA family outer membrane protein